LRTADDPPDPSGVPTQLPERVDHDCVAFPRLHAADLNEDRRIGRRAELLPQRRTLRGGEDSRPRVDWVRQHDRRDIVVQPCQRTGGIAAVADDQIGTDAPRDPLGPMRAGRDVVRPENERHSRALDHAAEERL
jgi:hypothetical protein